jgi:hypothetical protein
MLRTIPEFVRLRQATTLSVWGNPLLEQIAGFPELDALLGVSVPEDGGSLSIGENPALARVVAGPRLAVANRIEFVRNANLVSIEIDSLTSVNFQIVVASNPRLNASTLERLEAIPAAARKITGNQPEVEAADPCPWTNDGFCDEAPVDGLCVLGSDASDCLRDGEYTTAHGIELTE